MFDIGLVEILVFLFLFCALMVLLVLLIRRRGH